MTQKYSRKRKRSESYKIKLNKAMDVLAKVYTETIDDGEFVYQNFRITVSNEKFLTYFFDDRYNAYYDLEKKISEYLVGDGENILFEKKSVYKNLISVVYRKKDKDLKVKNKNDSFTVKTTIPNNSGCLNCAHFRKKNKVCTYYQIVNIKIVDNCKDFRQK